MRKAFKKNDKIQLRQRTSRKLDFTFDYAVVNLLIEKIKYIICESSYITIAVTIALRSHLFSFRTQKLSSIALKVLGWTRPGRIGSCRISLFLVSSAVEQSAVNRWVASSNLARGAILHLQKSCQCIRRRDLFNLVLFIR